MLHKRQTIMMFVTLMLAAAITGCSGSGGAAESPDADAGRPGVPEDLDGTEWVLISLDGSSLLEGSNVTLNFTEEQFNGFAGCNGYGGEYTVTGEGALTIPAVEVTQQLCQVPAGIMQQEDAYLKALTNANTYRMTHDRLEIEDGSGETTLVFVVKEESAMDPSDLAGTQWQLISINADSPIEGWTITLVFHDENSVSGSAGCRGYVGGYTASGDDISFPWLAMMGMACPEQEALMSQEGRYTDGLSWANDYRLGEGQLEILTAQGETLMFKPLLEEVNASLERTRWVLTAFIEEKAVEGMAIPLLMPTDLLAETEITATFEDGTVSGSAGCNTYFSAYTLDGTNLAFENPAATEMACLDPAGVMEQEQRYLNSLGDVVAHRIYGGQLWLETDDGSALVLTAADVSEP